MAVRIVDRQGKAERIATWTGEALRALRATVAAAYRLAPAAGCMIVQAMLEAVLKSAETGKEVRLDR